MSRAVPSPALLARHHERGLRGEWPAVRLAVAIDSADPVCSAWGRALLARRWLAGLERGPLPELARLEGLSAASPAARPPVAATCAHLARAALLAFDTEALDRVNAVHALACGDETGEAAVRLAVQRGWAAWLGDRPVDDDRASDLARLAKQTGAPDLVIEAASLRAASALARGEVSSALRHGRRASRMARTESIPHEEYLAGIVLARARRLDNVPHLSTRILSALRRVAPPPWKPWIDWEMVLSTRAGETPDRGPTAQALVDCLLATHAGHKRFGEVSHRLWARLERAPHIRREAETILALLDPSHALPGSGPAREWASGRIHPIPGGLSALGVDESHGQESAYVQLAEDGSCRRFLRSGLGLSRAVVLDPGVGRQLRTATLMAVLALAGPGGMTEPELFLEVYGFAYKPSIHQGVRRVLYHRVRRVLGDHASLHRDGDRLFLQAHSMIAFPDPRCTPTTEDDLVRLLSKVGVVTAQRAAELLGMPVRTARDGLRRLADEGVCRLGGEARRHEYVLEDTTFSEPTRG